MLQAMNTGHEGSLTTIHANTPRDALHRLEMMVLMAGVELPLRAMREQIASRVRPDRPPRPPVDGSRRVSRITEVFGLEGDVVTLQDLFVTRATDDESGSALAPSLLGPLRSTGLRPNFLDKLGDARRRAADERLRGGVDVTRRLRDRRRSRRLSRCSSAGQAAGSPAGLRPASGRAWPTTPSSTSSCGRRRRPQPPRVFENGKPVTGVDVQSLGESKAIVLAIDRSKSMHGAPARPGRGRRRGSSCSEKRQSDRVAVVTFGSTALAQSRLADSRRSTPTPRCARSTPTRSRARRSHDAVVVSSAELDSQGLAGPRADPAHRRARRPQPRELGRGRRRPRRRRTSSSTRSCSATPTAHRSRSSRGRPAAPSTRARHRPSSRASTSRIGAELQRTWRISYTTAARPGRRDQGEHRAQARAVASPSSSPARRRAGTGAGCRAGSSSGAWGVLLLLAAVGDARLRRRRRAPDAAARRPDQALVRAHTDPRGDAGERRSGSGRRSTLVLAALDERLRGMRRFDARSSASSSAAAVPVSASTVVVGARPSSVLLVAIFAAGRRPASTVVFVVCLLRARRGRSRT